MSTEAVAECTAMGLFTVRKSTLITALSTILGYIIILVQFHQNDVSTKPTISNQAGVSL